MANKDLRTAATTICGPCNKSRELWYYESAGGVEIMCSSGTLGTITWRKLRGMLKRKDKPSK